MSFALCGPFPMDLGSISWSARRAMDNLQTGKLRGLHESISRPGLYLIVHLESTRTGQSLRQLAGFWLSFREDYLSGGPAGPPDRSPPFVNDLLIAVTEQVWWVNLETWPRKGPNWGPVVVLEWPPSLSSRSTLPPPGSPLPEEAGGMVNTNLDDWSQPTDTRSASSFVEDPFSALPNRRSLLTIVRCRLTKTRATHSGEYQMLSLDHFASDQGQLPIQSWMEMAWNKPIQKTKPLSEHQLGPALSLPADRVGFLLSGWLTRDLSLWPATPADIRPAQLGERDVSNPIARQFFQAITNTGGVILGTLALGVLVNLLAHPSFGPAPKTEALEAQPALATCSADHDLFIEELRCQVAHFAKGGAMSEPDCLDLPEPPLPAETEDLQAEWCGLVDRPVPPGTFPESSRPIDMAEVAATRACFNVLRRPYRYDLSTDPSHYHLPDPVLFLDDPRLKIASLADIVTGLHEECGRVRTRIERKVEGAVFATHVGVTEQNRGLEAEKLRHAMVQNVTSAMHREEEKDCFMKGAQSGWEADTNLNTLCGNADALSSPVRKTWGRLGAGNVGTSPVIRRYAQARFGKNPAKDSLDSLWTCYQDLESAQNPTTYHSSWSLPVPEPHTWSIDGGGVYAELTLDAMLRDIAGGTAVSPCWEVVSTLLSPYQPLHPMLGTQEPGTWPSHEQQLCGQICAVYYHVRNTPAESSWSTPREDLLTCLGPKTTLGNGLFVRRGAAPPSVNDVDDGFDFLRMPWNAPFGKDDDTWVPPSDSALCAYNLLAQGYLSEKDKPVLIEGIQPATWAGTLSSFTEGKAPVGEPTAIAGGTDGAAYQAAVSLNSYGRAHSIANCGHVAAECFAGRMLDVMRENPNHMWVSAWASDLAGLYQTQDADPWCTLIQPFLAERGTAHEGQLDYPCTQGVDLTRSSFNRLVDHLAVSRQEAR